jgi:predicted MFS family arabinose efflux permease
MLPGWNVQTGPPWDYLEEYSSRIDDLDTGFAPATQIAPAIKGLPIMQQPAPQATATPSPSALPFWALILTVGTIVGIATGRGQSMGLYQLPVVAELKVGREPFSTAMAMAQLMTGIGAPFSGALMDKLGAFRVVLGCVILSIAGLYLMYAATSGFDLMISGVLLGFGISGTGVNALAGTMGRLAPPEKRLAAIASLGMAGGIGGFIALPFMHFLIELTGWKQSLLWLMAITLLMVPLAWPVGAKPASAATAGGPKALTMGEALREAFAHPSFWLLTSGFFVCGFHVAFIMVHFPAYTRDIGLPGWVGPWALGLIGLTNIIGTFLAGQSGKFIEKRRGLSLIYFGRALIFLALLLLPPTPVTVLVLCGMLGLLWLATIPLTSGLVATFFGTTWMSMLFGIVFLSHQVGAFLGVWMAGLLFDATKSYNMIWWISIGLGLLSALLNWPIKEGPVARLAVPAKA